MPLTTQQVTDLQASITGYAFPPVYYDFYADAQVNAGTMQELELVIRNLLISPNPQDVKYGLANVIYWGNANAGYQMNRVMKFINGVTNQQISQFQGLVAGGVIPTLHQIFQLHMPQFSGISFISKIIAFLDPTNYAVLDLLLARLRNMQGHKSLYRLKIGTQIRVTAVNSAAYYAWCQECQTISNQYYGGVYRAVDIERGIFNLIQNGQMQLAQEIYRDA